VFTAASRLALGEHGTPHRRLSAVSCTDRWSRFFFFFCFFSVSADTFGSTLSSRLCLPCSFFWSSSRRSTWRRRWLDLLSDTPRRRGTCFAVAAALLPEPTRPRECLSRWAWSKRRSGLCARLDAALVSRLKQASRRTLRPAQWYVIAEDRWEVNNVLQHHLEESEDYQSVLLQRFGETPEQPRDFTITG